MQKYPIPAARAIIVNEKNEVLLLKRSAIESYSEYWCLPGGKVDFGFTVEETIKKEIKEETNLSCTSAEFVFYQDSLSDENFREHYLSFYFYCKVLGDIKLNDESDEYEWVSTQNLEMYNIGFGNGVGIKRFFQ